jgi:hypothetical protein
MEYELEEDFLLEDQAWDEWDSGGAGALDSAPTDAADRPLWDWQHSPANDQAICIPEQEDG